MLGVGQGGGAVMEAITKDQLENFEIILPPLKLQDQFEEAVNTIVTQKQIGKRNINDGDCLFQSLLHQAFNGELV